MTDQLFRWLSLGMQAATMIGLGYGLFVVNSKLDQMVGRVDTLERGHTAHVNSATMHGR